MSERALASLTALLEQEGDVDDVLRGAVVVLADEPAVSWAGVRLLEDGVFVLGPSAGEPDETRRTTARIAYRGDIVGELVADGDVDQAVLARFADLIAPHALLGWDTGGNAWEP